MGKNIHIYSHLYYIESTVKTRTEKGTHTEVTQNTHLHVVFGLQQDHQSLGELEVPLEGDVAVVLVVEVLHLLCAPGRAAHHGDESRSLGTLLRVCVCV